MLQSVAWPLLWVSSWGISPTLYPISTTKGRSACSGVSWREEPTGLSLSLELLGQVDEHQCVSTTGSER